MPLAPARSFRGLALATSCLLAAGIALPPTEARAQNVPDAVAIDVGATAESFGDWLKLALTRTALAFSRLAVDLTYETSEIVPGTGGVLITGLRVGLPLPGLEPRACTVEVEALELTSSTLALLTSFLGSSEMVLRGVSAPLACLPPQGRFFAQMARLQEIGIDMLRLETMFDPISASADIDLELDARDLARIELAGRLDYVSLRIDAFGTPKPDGSDPDPVPVIEFGPMDLSVTDRGLVERLPPFLGMAGLPLDAVAPSAAQMLRAQFGTPELATEVERELARFLNEGGRLTVSLRPGELWLDEIMHAPPREVATAFNPRVGRTTRPNLPSPELIEAATSNLVRPEQAITVARAFLSGEGMPRNPRRAFEAIESAARTYDTDYAGEAREIAVRALLASDGDMETAYRMAIEAGTAGREIAALTRLVEARLEPAQIVAAQKLAATQWDGSPASQALAARVVAAVGEGDTAALLDVARDFERGVGVPRDLSAAFGFALLAKAAGEVGASRIVERVEAMATADEAAREAWGDALAEARDTATEIWLQGGLARTLAARDG